MTSTEILGLIRRLVDVWVDFQVGGWFLKAMIIWNLIDWMFDQFRETLIKERAAKEDLDYPVPTPR